MLYVLGSNLMVIYFYITCKPLVDTCDDFWLLLIIDVVFWVEPQVHSLEPIYYYKKRFNYLNCESEWMISANFICIFVKHDSFI